MTDWNTSISEYPRSSTVHELFALQAAKSPDAIACTDGNEQLSYRGLERKSNQLAWRLVGAGVGLETRVAICVDRSISMIVAMLGVLKAGGSYVPLDSKDPGARMGVILKDANVGIVLTDAIRAPRFTGCEVRVLDVAAQTQEEPVRDRVLPISSGPDCAAYVMYTSGTTGVPKGVEVLHRGIVRLVRNTNYVSLLASDVMGQVANPAFDAATFEVWGALLNGARLAILPSETVLSPRRFAAAIRQEKITTMFLTASLFHVIAASEPEAFGTMRTLIVGGDAVDAGAARRVLETNPPGRLVNGYGPTECTTFSICHWIQSVSPDAKSVPIGRPISNSEAYILDETLRPVSPGVTGDLYLGGDGLARGYVDRPELTAERFIPHPFCAKPGARLYKTGDRARLLEDGVIEFLGRRDDQVKFHGFRIELTEIAIALRNHPAVIEAVAFVARVSAHDDRLVAYVSAASGAPPSPLELRRHCELTLPGYMIPSHYVVLEEFPLTPVGKIDRSALQVPLASLSVARVTRDCKSVEDEIKQVWREVLSLSDVSLDDNFFDVGGTSLTLALVEHKLRDRIPGSFEITDLLRFPTIRTLAEHLSDSRTSGREVDRLASVSRQKAAFNAVPRRIQAVRQTVKG